jgi:hypothetical protein
MATMANAGGPIARSTVLHFDVRRWPVEAAYSPWTRRPYQSATSLADTVIPATKTCQTASWTKYGASGGLNHDRLTPLNQH